MVIALAMLTPHWPVALAAALVSVLTLYRAGLFIHELTHIRKQALPGFRLAWNALVGVPLNPWYLLTSLGWMVLALVGGGLYFISRERDFAVRI